jgi:flavin reductase (DIM6/NTAB) family NADH-FMN oxidoreductase RutF
MQIDPDKISVRENYKLMIGSILPRPIAFVSTISPTGILNLAPYSFFTGITSNPPTIGFAPARKSPVGDKKDTLSNIEATKEFVVNIVTEDIAEQMNETSTNFPAEIDEFKVVGLTPVSSHIVKPPRVAESPINMECRLHDIVYIGKEEPGGGALVIGKIILFHIQDDLIKNGRINTERLRPIGRLAGQEYTTLGRRFVLERKPYKEKS